VSFEPPVLIIIIPENESHGLLLRDPPPTTHGEALDLPEIDRAARVPIHLAIHVQLGQG